MRITVELERPRLGRRRWLVIAAIAALVVPAAAFANHQFTDVPTSHTFHGDISDAKNAGLTSGCSPTTFCPDSNLTRAQMTGFLNRGLGRASHGDVFGAMTSSTPVVAGTVTIKAGNVTGGTALVHVQAAVQVYGGAGCPCEARVTLVDGTGSPVTSYFLVDLPAVPSGDTDTDGSAALLAMDVVPTGVAQTYQVIVTRQLGTSTVTAYGDLTATYFPFDGDGNAVSTTSVSDAGSDPRAGGD